MADFPDSTTLTKSKGYEHPVDQISMSLHKMEGILHAVMGNYDDLPDGEFKIPAKYIHIALYECGDLLENAREGLDRLSGEFDLNEKPESRRARGKPYIASL